MSEDWIPEGIYGLMRTLVKAARLDKKMIKEDGSIFLGRQVASFIPHVNIPSNAVRRFLLQAYVESETIYARLKGHKVLLAVPIEARVLMMDMLMTSKETSLQIPEKVRMLRIEG